MSQSIKIACNVVVNMRVKREPCCGCKQSLSPADDAFRCLSCDALFCLPCRATQLQDPRLLANDGACALCLRE